jgi:hypothetical protein
MVQSGALEVVIAMEGQDKVRQEITALKLALISADPVTYVPQFYPEIVVPPPSDIGRAIDAIEETTMIDFDLTPPSTTEAAEVIEALLADKTVTFNGTEPS